MTPQVTNTAMPQAGAERGPVMLMAAAGLRGATFLSLDVQERARPCARAHAHRAKAGSAIQRARRVVSGPTDLSD